MQQFNLDTSIHAPGANATKSEEGPVRHTIGVDREPCISKCHQLSLLWRDMHF